MNLKKSIKECALPQLKYVFLDINKYRKILTNYTFYIHLWWKDQNKKYKENIPFLFSYTIKSYCYIYSFKL